MHTLPAHNAKKNIVSVLLAISLLILLSLTKEGNGVFTPKGQYNVVGFGEIIILSLLLFIALVSSCIELYRFIRQCYIYISSKIRRSSKKDSVLQNKVQLKTPRASQETPSPRVHQFLTNRSPGDISTSRSLVSRTVLKAARVSMTPVNVDSKLVPTTPVQAVPSTPLTN